MPNRLAPDRQAVMADRFARVVELWLDGLPAAGFEGTSKELADALEAVNRRERLSAHVPLTIGSAVPAMVPVLEARGFGLTHKRTKAARLVRVARAAG